MGNVSTEAWGAVSARRGIDGNGTAAADGTLGETTVLQQAVVQHQCPDNRQVERETCRNPHHMPATLQHGWRQAGSLRAENIGCVHRMSERRQVSGIVEQFNSDQHAVLRQAQRVQVLEAPQRDMFRRVRCIGEPAGPGIEPAPTTKQNAAPKACAVRSRAPTLADFDTPSTPMPK